MEAQVGRPEVLVKGAIWWEPIEDVFKMESIDHATPQDVYDALPAKEQQWHKTWTTVLESKRSDEHYADVVESIKEHGFIRPVTVQLDDYGTDLRYGDGHHRLAAAVDLGMSHILVQLAGHSWDEAVSYDSGSWYRGDPVPEENNISSWSTCAECGEEYSNDASANACCSGDEEAMAEAEKARRAAIGDDNDDEPVDLHEHPSQRNYENWCEPCGSPLWSREKHNEAHREGRLSH